MQAVIKDGKVDGKPIIRAWESFTGWYWFATERVENGTYFGFVVGIYPEWGYFSVAELSAVGPMVCELNRPAIELIDMEVRG